jgi:hypothetical protein
MWLEISLVLHTIQFLQAHIRYDYVNDDDFVDSDRRRRLDCVTRYFESMGVFCCHVSTTFILYNLFDMDHKYMARAQQLCRRRRYQR